MNKIEKKKMMKIKIVHRKFVKKNIEISVEGGWRLGKTDFMPITWEVKIPKMVIQMHTIWSLES